MQYQNLLLTAVITISANCTPFFTAANFSPVNAASVKVSSQIAAASILTSGDFEKSEHPTSGAAQVVSQNGKKYLKFDSSFQSDSGPDLFVLLHRQAAPKNYNKANYVSLGRLKKISGQQAYLIPSGVDITKFKSAVIWCRKFNATFGFAQLN